MKFFCDGNKKSWFLERIIRALPELVLVEPHHPGQQIIWLPVGVEPAHLHVTKLAVLCAQSTLNFYLTHVRSAWATATFSSLVLQFQFSCSGFHITSTQTMGNGLCLLSFVEPFQLFLFSHYQQNKFLAVSPTYRSNLIPQICHDLTTLLYVYRIPLGPMKLPSYSACFCFSPLA